MAKEETSLMLLANLPGSCSCTQTCKIQR